MTEPTWHTALNRHSVPRALATRARRRPFSVESAGAALIVAASTGTCRRITQRQFEESLPLVDHAPRAPLQAVSRNSSYIEAILDDMRDA